MAGWLCRGGWGVDVLTGMGFMFVGFCWCLFVVAGFLILKLKQNQPGMFG